MSASGSINCEIFYASVGQGKQDKIDPLRVRQSIIDLARKENLPAMIRSTPSGDLPVVLLNFQTYEQLWPMILQSVGLQVSLHPGGGTDHGMFRMKDQMIDLYNPSERENGGGEIHKTGISWKYLKDYLDQRRTDSRKILDMVFTLTKKDADSVEYYHRVRRAVFYRVPYAFTTRNYNFSNAEWNQLPHMLDSAEHCYTFPAASSASSHLRTMTQQLEKLGLKNISQILMEAKVKEFLSKAKAIILSADHMNPQAFNYQSLLKNNDLEKTLEGIIPAGLSEEDRITVLSYLIGIDSINQLQDVFVRYEINANNRFISDQFQYATALFVYDNSPGAEERIRQGTYETVSDNYSFRNDGKNRPINDQAKGDRTQ